MFPAFGAQRAGGTGGCRFCLEQDVTEALRRMGTQSRGARLDRSCLADIGACVLKFITTQHFLRLLPQAAVGRATTLLLAPQGPRRMRFHTCLNGGNAGTLRLLGPL